MITVMLIFQDDVWKTLGRVPATFTVRLGGAPIWAAAAAVPARLCFPPRSHHFWARIPIRHLTLFFGIFRIKSTQLVEGRGTAQRASC
jgi:hypothetical protein